MRSTALAGPLALAACLSGCYMTMARVSPQLQGRLLDHGQPVSGAQLFVTQGERPGQCGDTPRDALVFLGGAFELPETRQPEWVYPNPRYAAWTLCISYQGHTYVGYGMAKLDYPPPQLSLRCDLSTPLQHQTEHVADVYGLCTKI
ncbi:MAG: hypothetical protein P4L83_22175 [Nevskia sp.]|nr:hypothetical protein [Nevskia sp.]